MSKFEDKQEWMENAINIDINKIVDKIVQRTPIDLQSIDAVPIVPPILARMRPKAPIMMKIP
jgi:hypothetical protein